jgi:hypothetical protein
VFTVKSAARVLIEDVRRLRILGSGASPVPHVSKDS